MYSFSYLEPVCCSMSSCKCCFLTCIQVSQEVRSEFSTVYCDPHKGFVRVNKEEIDVFLELSCFFDNPPDVGNLISGSLAFSKTSLNICKFSVHVFCWSLAWKILSTILLACEWDKCNYAVVWAFFGITLLRDWDENRPFPVLWPQSSVLWLSFPNLLAYWVQHFHNIIL